MKKICLSALIASALIIQSCIPSLYPLYTANVLTYNEEIEGAWIQFDEPIFSTSKKASPSALWHFDQKDNKYQLAHIDEQGMLGVFESHLVQLGNDFYLNFFPEGNLEKSEIDRYSSIYRENIDSDFTSAEEGEVNAFFAMHLIRGHSFAKIDVVKDTLLINFFGSEWLEKSLEKDPSILKHMKSGEDLILTAKPEEIQKFILDYSGEHDLFESQVRLVIAQG